MKLKVMFIFVLFFSYTSWVGLVMKKTYYASLWLLKINYWNGWIIADRNAIKSHICYLNYLFYYIIYFLINIILPLYSWTPITDLRNLRQLLRWFRLITVQSILFYDRSFIFRGLIIQPIIKITCMAQTMNNYYNYGKENC